VKGIEMMEILEELEKASRHRVDDETLMRATMIYVDEWNRRPIRRFINFLNRIRRLFL